MPGYEELEFTDSNNHVPLTTTITTSTPSTLSAQQYLLILPTTTNKNRIKTNSNQQQQKLDRYQKEVFNFDENAENTNFRRLDGGIGDGMPGGSHAIRDVNSDLEFDWQKPPRVEMEATTVANTVVKGCLNAPPFIVYVEEPKMR